MPDFDAEASDTDLADQARPVDDPSDETDPFGGGTAASAEADPADLLEQQQRAPLPDDEYDR